ncbi:hypothetical protein [Streptomyces termitum]|uniref:hypothetical protein n=1 Tax=Streptomyces termitum TaxID=67368 RepID=UPI0033B00533
MTDTTEAAAVVPQPEPYVPEALGGIRLAGLLAEHTGEPVTLKDVAELVAQKHLEVIDRYKGWPMYFTAAARELDVELVRAVVAATAARACASSGSAPLRASARVSIASRASSAAAVLQPPGPAASARPQAASTARSACCSTPGAARPHGSTDRPDGAPAEISWRRVSHGAGFPHLYGR